MFVEAFPPFDMGSCGAAYFPASSGGSFGLVGFVVLDLVFDRCD